MTMALWHHMFIALHSMTFISLILETTAASIPIKEWNRCPTSESKITSFWGVSVQTCSKKCDITKNCLSFNYYPRGKYCDLLTNYTSGDRDTKPRRPFLHIVRSKQHSKNVCFERDGDCAVKVSGCPKAVVANATVLGNICTVGSRIKVDCHAGYMTDTDTLPIICGKDGKWTNLSNCSAGDINGSTSYTIGFLSNYNHPRIVYIVTSHPTTVVISNPLRQYSDTFTVNMAIEIKLPVFLTDRRDTGEFPDGIRIESDTPFGVYVENGRERSSDATVVIPDSHLSMEYILLSWSDNETYNKAVFVVVATDDDTVVNVSFPHDSQLVVNLNSNEVYSYKTTRELSGSIIQSSNKVAVFAGHECSNVITPLCDHLYEQMPPVSDLQTEFIVSYPYPRYKYVIRVTTTADNTNVELSNELHVTLRRAEVWQRLCHGETIHISANNPILVAVYSLGRQSEPRGYSNIFDGSMLVVPGLSQFKSEYTFYVPKSADMCVLMITYPSYMSSLNNIRLNHVHLIANKSVDVIATGKRTYTILYAELTTGTHVIYTTSGTPFGAYLSFFRFNSQSWFSLPYKF